MSIVAKLHLHLHYQGIERQKNQYSNYFQKTAEQDNKQPQLAPIEYLIFCNKVSCF